MLTESHIAGIPDGNARDVIDTKILILFQFCEWLNADMCGFEFWRTKKSKDERNQFLQALEVQSIQACIILAF